MAHRASWAHGIGGTKAHKFAARPVIVTRELAILERETIVQAALARGIGLERPPTRSGRVEKVPLAVLAEQVGLPGEHFRSKREAGRYIELRRAESAGVIRALRRNPNFKLHTVTPHGLKVRISEYTGDFEYDERGDGPEDLFTPADWAHIIEESKGFPTPDWELRKKWVEAEYGIAIRVT